jgi:hypothetical protein
LSAGIATVILNVKRNAQELRESKICSATEVKRSRAHSAIEDGRTLTKSSGAA